MSVAVVPLPVSRVPLPERCLVTGRTEGVRLQEAPVHVLFAPPEPVCLPLTDEGRDRLEKRIRGTWVRIGAATALGVAIAAGLSIVMAGLGGFLALITLVVGWVAARWWRQKELYALSRREDLLTLEIPREDVAEDVRSAVRRAELEEDTQARLASAQEYGERVASQHPIAR